MLKKLSFLSIALFFLLQTVYALPGALDPVFGLGGIAAAPIGKGGYDQSAAAAMQTDGKIVIVGDSRENSETFSDEPVNSIVSRVNADGALDTSFGFRGIARLRLPGRANAVIIQADGKIVVAGFTFIEPGNLQAFFVARFNTNGALDTSFGSAGKLTTSFSDLGQRGIATALAVQPDGKIIAAGYSFFSSTGSPQSMAVVRYTSNGTLDNSFDGDGRAFIDLAASGSRANAVALQADGKIVLGGLLRESVGTVSDFALARLNADGTLDNSFDGDGKLTTDFSGTTTNVIGLGLQADGKIVAAGNSIQGTSRDIAMARYNADGSLDTSFDGDGKLTTDIGDDLVGGMRIQSDGKIMVCGQSIPPSNLLIAFMSVRYNSDGSLDTGYNGTGKVTTEIPDRVSRANAVFIRTDNKVVLAGHTNNFTVSDFAVLRYQSNGQPDTTFDGDGVAVVEPGNSADWLQEMAVQPDGKIVAAGYSYSASQQNMTVARFLPNGALDTNFGTQGSATYMIPGFDTYANEVIVQPDGKILVSVGSYFLGKFYTLRYNPDGTPDASFGTNGVAAPDVGLQGDNAAAMALQPDGKIVIAGTSNDTPSVGFLTLMRMNPNGTLDNTFASSGFIRFGYTTHQNSITSMTLQSDGKILIAGDDSTSGSEGFFVGRFTSAGGFDNSFGESGAAYAAFGLNAHVSTVAVQRDGKIVLVGHNGSLNGAIARFNTGGSPDATFDGDGKLVVPAQSGTQFLLTDVAFQRNGKIVASATGYIPPSQGIVNDGSAMLRFNPDGSGDQFFGTGGVAYNSIGDAGNGFNTALVMPTGRLLAGGYSSNGANDDFTLARFIGDPGPRFDYDGDGRSDVSVYRPSAGDWYVLNSSSGFSGVHFGATGDMPAPGDFDGDGKTDISVFRPSGGDWFRLNSSDNSFTGLHFGATEDKPAVGDFDGDGKADISVFRPSAGDWYRLNSSDGQFVGLHFGISEDKPAVGDFDGDGKSDICVFRPSTGSWFRLNSSNNGFVGLNFGIAEDKPVPEDYDGDGKTDIAVYRPSSGDWFWLNSGSGNAFSGLHWGSAGDKPAVADFDGDGKADISVFRPTDGNWYQLNSTAGYAAVHFGVSEDIPTTASFLY